MTGVGSLTSESLESILQRIPHLRIGVVGDLFLDRYLDLDAALTEPSLETGLEAYQVVGVRSYPGAAGTVVNNLVALGVGCVCPIAVLGDDGEGYELRQVLSQQGVIDPAGLILTPERRTPTYTKPMLQERAASPRELNRLDIKNRRPMPEALEREIVETLVELWPGLDAIVVVDQVSEEDCGVITGRVRARLAELAETVPDKFILADSRERIALFRGICLKPNRQEAIRAASIDIPQGENTLEHAVVHLARQAGRTVFCTDGARGILIASPQDRADRLRPRVPAFPVRGPIDIVGAGDSTSAGIVCAMASGSSEETAAGFGNLVASITIQQLGTTGTASPAQVRQRFSEGTRFSV